MNCKPTVRDRPEIHLQATTVRPMNRAIRMDVSGIAIPEKVELEEWIPAFAGMTRSELGSISDSDMVEKEEWIPAFAAMTRLGLSFFPNTRMGKTNNNPIHGVQICSPETSSSGVPRPQILP